MAIFSSIAKLFKKSPPPVQEAAPLPAPKLREFNFRPLFRSAQMQADFERDGYVVLRDKMISGEEIRQLRALFAEVEPKDGLGTMYSNTYNVQDPAFNEKVDREVKEVLGNRVAELFDDCVLAGGAFLVKGTGDKSSSNLHQDWNNVDETKNLSLSIWLPLVDVDQHNGCLWVAPGSHLLPHSIRSFTQPSVFMEFDQELVPHIVPVPLKAGEACIYAHNTFHGSQPNRSDAIRVAIVAGILPAETDIVHYHRESPGAPMQMLKTGVDFYYKYMGQLVQGDLKLDLPVLEEVASPPPALSREQAIHSFSHLPRFRNEQD